MEKQDIYLIKQIQKEEVSWNQKTINQALTLRNEGYIEYILNSHSGQWELTERGKKEIGEL